ncbi:MAG: glycosyltransferase family 2 protein [Patescibacteria group bacterium]
MDLSVIIVSWNVKEKLRDNLRALYNSKGDFSFEVFVIDNNSSDGSVEMVKADFPQVKLIANQSNLGFARACNQGIQESSGDFVLLLNPDMKVFSDTLFLMFSWMRDKNSATVAGCHLVDSEGKTVRQVRRFPTLRDQLAIVLKLPHLFKGITKKYLYSDFDYSQDQKVDSIRGSFFMISKRSYNQINPGKLPLLDERYFIWFEEVDFCQQVYQLGGEVWYNSSARCEDYVGASFSQVKRGQTQLYFRSSMLKYFYKWRPCYEYLILWLAWLPILILSKLLCLRRSR